MGQFDYGFAKCSKYFASSVRFVGSANPARGAFPRKPRGCTVSGTCSYPSPKSSNTDSKPHNKVCVLGAGVIGLTTAVKFLEEIPGLQVTVVAENLGANTTSHGAGGLWKPYTLGDTPAGLINRWGKATLDHYLSLYMSSEAKDAGVMLTSAYQLWKEPVPDPEWSTIVPSFRHLTTRELEIYDPEASHTHGWFYTTVVTEGRLYMSWLLKRFLALGGITEQKKVDDVRELYGFDIIVNCSGLGAVHLFDDRSMYPVRGQVLRVKAPWVRHYCNSNGDCYIIPNTDTVVLGGTLQRGDTDLTPRKEDTEEILQKCIAVMPSLRTAEIQAVWVGLRPGRPSVRLDVEYINNVNGTLPVIHNYGHGGAGLTLAWGCAEDVVQAVASM